jgi:DNA-binding CsgD family transcriptional regulator
VLRREPYAGERIYRHELEPQAHYMGQKKRGADASSPTQRTGAARKSINYDPFAARSAAAGFTRREREVQFWVVRGKKNEEVAQILSANSHTIRKHVENIRRKAGVESRLALIAAFWLNEVDKRDWMIAELRRQLAR